VQLGWPEGEVRETELFVASYPFAHASVFPGKAAVPAARITAIFCSISDAAFVLDGKEIVFLPRQCKPGLDAFASRHCIPSPNIREVWSDLAEPYLDTEYSAEQEARDFQSLTERGYDRKEVRALRRHIAPTMLTATWFTFEWGLYTTQDVLRAFAIISPQQLTEQFYWNVMEVALRPYRNIDTAAASRLAALKTFWDAAWSELRLAPPPGLYARVTGRYLEPHRSYHTLRHLEECFALFDAARHLSMNAGEVLIALWLHDAVYLPKSRDSEEASARWAEKILHEAGATSDIIGRVRELILATKHDASPSSADAGVLVDIDLAILASDAERFEQYETQVRQEYAHVPDIVFRMGRAKILKQFLARPWIYTTPYFRERFEQNARDNLARSLARL
jgi:predicted metal-dependent HD superfamily phosphohydrolase